MQKYHTSSAKYCLEHTKFPDDFLKIKSMLTGKWIIWSDLNHFWVKKNLKNNSIQSIHKPGSSKTLNMEKKFKV